MTLKCIKMFRTIQYWVLCLGNMMHQRIHSRHVALLSEVVIVHAS